MKLKEIADRIAVHLKRIEADPVLNKNTKEDRRGLSQFYWTDAHVAGRFVRVIYITYQGGSNLTKDTAIAYLAALDSGYNGKHWRLPLTQSDTNGEPK